MRPTIEIICAITDSRPVTVEECKMALMAMSAINRSVEESLRTVAQAVMANWEPASIKFHADGALELLSMMCAAREKDPLIYLGPANTPGTPEHAARQKMARNIFKQATGLDIDDPRPFEEQARERGNDGPA